MAMHLTEINTNSQAKSLALFCKVVDNFGDIGICWRMARQLQQEHGIAVTLWVDDLRSFQRICPQVTTDTEIQEIAGVTVRHWRDQQGSFTVADIADIVIEFFACDIPPDYIQAMAKCEQRPVWLNLEGLTAEEWVEGCHTLPSPHPSLPLTKHFFFPGFNSKTGGLLREARLDSERTAFQSDPEAMTAFLQQLGLTEAEISNTKVSLFCYPHAPVADLLEAWQSADTPVTCLVPEGVAAETVETYLGQAAKAGASVIHGGLTVRVLPFIPQTDYDKLLWACDINFVRGEDSFVRAQWANRPFIWHIYPQDKNLHHKKLNAFLKTATSATASLAALSHAWNAVSHSPLDWTEIWQDFQVDLPEIARLSGIWQEKLQENGDMTSNLLKFVNAVKVASQKDAV